MGEPLLAVDQLSIAFAGRGGETLAVRDVSFDISAGEVVGVVGESGSGKTSTALAVLGYLPRGGRIAGGGIRFNGTSLLALGTRERQGIFGRQITHVAQDPAASLNPALRIGTQLVEGMRLHLGLSAAEAQRRALVLLEEVHLPGGAHLMQSYPHQLSGGMQQRVCIAMALACDPQLIVMDEPTTGLDASTEAAVFDLLGELKARRGLSVMFISHNLAAIRGMADRVVILYGGRRMEVGPTPDVFARPRHRYTQMMLMSAPTMTGPIRRAEMPWQSGRPPQTGCPFRDRCDIAEASCVKDIPSVSVGPGHESACVRWHDLAALTDRGSEKSQSSTSDETPDVLLSVQDLSHRYRARPYSPRDAQAYSIKGVSCDVRRGEVVAVIGESGSGKTTLARCIVGLERPLSGSIRLGAVDLAQLRRYPTDVARNVQIVFQNIGGSLHPRKRIRAILERPYVLYEHRVPSETELERLAHGFGLRTELLPKLSTRLSGGERQRAALARAFVPRPALIVLDEAFSALDVSMKNKVMNLLLDKKGESDAAYLLISHDLPLVRSMAERVVVMYHGWVCESGPRRLLEQAPCHPYSEVLIWSALELEGVRPAHLDLAAAASATTSRPGTGCPFQFRCPRKLGAVCESTPPPLRDAGRAHVIACHIPVAELKALQDRERSTDMAITHEH